MFAKVFSQILDSSIAEDFTVRHVFMDLLVLADSEGAVDMTAPAIARRTNVPLKIVKNAIEKLSEPDPESRSKTEEGRRIIPIDSHREWGWIIVNYAHYRAITDNEFRRSYFRDQKRAQREKTKCPQVVLDKTVLSTPSTQAEGEAEGEEKGGGAAPRPSFGWFPEGFQTPQFKSAWHGWEEHLLALRKPMTPGGRRAALQACIPHGAERAIMVITGTMEKGGAYLYWDFDRRGNQPIGNGHRKPYSPNI